MPFGYVETCNNAIKEKRLRDLGRVTEMRFPESMKYQFA
jgi:hypothetical protein